MHATPQEIKGKWFLVRPAGMIELDGIRGTRSRLPGVPTFEYWTGEEWSRDESLGMEFESEVAAAQFSAMNERRM